MTRGSLVTLCALLQMAGACTPPDAKDPSTPRMGFAPLSGPAPAPMGFTPVAPATAAPAAPPPRATDSRPIAVLPLDEDELFRDERGKLRARLAEELGRRARGFVVAPIATVDEKIRPVSKTTGARCAFDRVPAERRASHAGFLTTNVMHVGSIDKKPPELWIEVRDTSETKVTFTGAWDPKLALAARYERAFASLVEAPGGGGVLGGVLGTGKGNGAREGAVEICEEKVFAACAPTSNAWLDRKKELEACFARDDEASAEVLLEPGAAATRCELTNVDDLGGPSGQRESCVCAALVGSAGVKSAAGRRRVRVHFEAPDLAGKPRPLVSVIDTSTNLHADAGWESLPQSEGGRTTYRSRRRLAIDDIDAFRAPLARCALPAGSLVAAELEVGESGVVSGAKAVTGTHSTKEAGCIEKALLKGALACTDDGKPASVRLAIAWPAVKGK